MSTSRFVDIKIQQHTNSSIARRSGTIKELAKRYNAQVAKVEKLIASRRTTLATPQRIDIEKLYDTNANRFMWEASTRSDLEAQQPHYMADTRIQEGINGMLALERAKEELQVLGEELVIMVKWLNTRLNKTRLAVDCCSGTAIVCCLLASYLSRAFYLLDPALRFQLERYHATLVEMGKKWYIDTKAAQLVGPRFAVIWPDVVVSKNKRAEMNDKANEGIVEEQDEVDEVELALEVEEEEEYEIDDAQATFLDTNTALEAGSWFGKDSPLGAVSQFFFN